MPEQHDTNTRSSESPVYQIRVKGHLDHAWADWFPGMVLTLDEGGDTMLTGPVVDQAALHGLLKKVRDLGLPLVSMNRLDQRQTHDTHE